jgi:hypothetical protein
MVYVVLVALFGMSALAAILYLLLTEQESVKPHGQDHTQDDR